MTLRVLLDHRWAQHTQKVVGPRDGTEREEKPSALRILHVLELVKEFHLILQPFMYASCNKICMP
eukprot:10283870-Karenia_brevis.AAC.1